MDGSSNAGRRWKILEERVYSQYAEPSHAHVIGRGSWKVKPDQIRSGACDSKSKMLMSIQLRVCSLGSDGGN